MNAREPDVGDEARRRSDRHAAYDLAMDHQGSPSGRSGIDLGAPATIAWTADGFDRIEVHARWRARHELDAFARAVADVALVNRTLADLRVGLRAAFPGAFDLEADARANGEHPGRVIVRFHPPKGEPNPDPAL
jgi:hypothetical protein